MNEDLRLDQAGHVSSGRGPQTPAEGDSLLGFFAAVGTMLVQIQELKKALIARAEQADIDDRRQQLLVAYKSRHAWRSSDVHALRSLGACDAALRRACRRRGRGRPHVRRYTPTGTVIARRLTMALRLFAENATEKQRRESFFVWPWWKHNVEALYRGELHACQMANARGAYDMAEHAVAAALRISVGRVHAVCSEIRAIRRDDESMANFPSMMVSEFERWMKTGVPPLHSRPQD